MAAPRRPGLVATIGAAAALLLGAAGAPDPPSPHMVSAGEQIALRNCAECHALGERDASPLADAPPFRNLRPAYPREVMAATLQQRMTAIHPRMPHLALDVDEIEDFLEYWTTIKPAAAPAHKPGHH